MKTINQTEAFELYQEITELERTTRVLVAVLVRAGTPVDEAVRIVVGVRP